MDRNSVKDFVIPSNSKALVQENVDRVRLLFTVEVSFTSNDLTSGKQWVNLRGNEEDRERAQTYIMSLCNQEVMNTIKLPRGLFNELRTDEKRSEIERLSCALVSFSDPETSEVSVYGSDIPVAMAVSVFEERLCVFSKQSGLDKFATTDGCLEAKAEKSSDTTTVCPTVGSDLNDRTHRAESATDIPPSMREFARKIKYTDNEIDVVVRTFGPEITINELLQELVKNSSSARQNGAALDDTKQLPVIRGNSVSSAPIRADHELVARGCVSAMRSRRPEAEQAIPQADIYRPIVIDGSNVAMNHGNQEFFSCRGIQLCVQYFARRGHQDITVFVPMWRKEESRPGSLIQNQEVLHELSRRNILKFTPSRSNGNRRIVCYDDKYIVELAEQNGGIIVSNDNFRDLLKENPRWKEAIEQRTLMYTFVGDRFMPPDDPLGRRGPSLDDFLRKGTSTHPKICPYLKNCTFGHRCKYYHPERDTRRQQITNSSPPENTVQHSSAGETTITTTSSHSPCQSRVISTNGSHGTITGEQRVSTPPRDVPYFQEKAFENRGRRSEGITARGRDMQPPPGVAPHERSRVLGRDEQVNPHYRGGIVYPEFRHPVPQEYGRTTQRYGNPVPNPVYPNLYPQPAAQWPPYATPVPYRNGYPAVMGHHAGQQPPYVNTFAYYEPATVPYGNLLGGAASRDRVDGTEDSKKEHCPVSKELLDSLVEKLKEISPREDVIVRVLLSHPSECEKRDLDALAGLVIDA